MSRKIYWPIIIILSALAAAVLAWGDASWVIRPYLLFWFILICPGMAVIGLLQIDDMLAEIVLSVALSFVLGTLVAEGSVLAKIWSPPAILAVLIGISLVGGSLQLKNALVNNRSTRLQR